MKNILSLIISGALVVSGFGQTRNVLVGTNNAVVQPTNFWSADAANARTGLGLGTAATNPASAFQPASANLTSLAAGDGSSLTNLNLSGLGAIGITNIAGLQDALDAKLGTNGSALNLTNFPQIVLQTNSDVVNFPAGLLRTNGNASGLTNITAANITGTVALASNITGTAPLATNVTGTVAIANGGTGSTNASEARTSLGATTVGSGLFTLVNPSDVRFLRINANNTISSLSAADFRSALSVGTNLGTVTSVGLSVPSFLSVDTATITSSGTFSVTLNNQTSRRVFIAPNGGGVPAFRLLESDDLPSLAISKITGLQTALDSKLATTGTAALATNVTGVVSVSNGGTGGTNAATARSGIGATTVGSSIFTLSNPSAIRFLRLNADNTASALSDSDFRTAIGLGTTNAVQFGILTVNGDLTFSNNGIIYWGIDPVYSPEDGTVMKPVGFDTPTIAAQTRTNLGIPWSGLTSTNAATFQTALFGAGTNPVLVDTNGSVVSPSNFWQAAPIATALQNSTPIVSSTNAATNARLLFLFSLAPSTVGVTNTITMPTNGNTFNGDVATITHSGPTSSVTAIRQLGASTNLITLNQAEESVRLLYRNNQWTLMDNISQIEPIYFSGTNAVDNAAASRTNLGIPLAALTNTSNASFRTAIELGTTNNVAFSNVTAFGFITAIGAVTTTTNLSVGGTFNVTNKAETRTNLGLPLPALTNTSNTNFQAAIFSTNVAPTNVANVNSINFNTAVGWMSVTVQTNGTNATFRIPLFQ